MRRRRTTATPGTATTSACTTSRRGGQKIGLTKFDDDMKQKCVGTAVLGASLVVVPLLIYAQAADIGKREYVNSCAVCHGTVGGEMGHS